MGIKRALTVLLALCTVTALFACAPLEDSLSTGTSVPSGVLSVTESIEASGTEVDFLPSNIEPAPNGELAVHYLDVGQGDSIFIELPDGKCMLIDASISEYGDRIVDAIRALSYDRIDYVVATHPHADHIGGMEQVLKSFEIGCIYLPDVSADTATYVGMAETILERDIPAEAAETGVTLLSGDVQAKFLAPSVIDEDDQNRNSAVLLLTYGERTFLFMGDADTSIEDSLQGDINCDVLKVGHHGSRTASGSDFLRRATPTYAIISCGEGNSYGHPHEEALSRLQACGAEILRTDLVGTVTVRTDGKTLTVETQRGQGGDPSESGAESTSQAESESENTSQTESEPEAGGQTWVLNTSNHKIHRPDCQYVDSIAPQNRTESDKTVSELEAEGYTPCSSCKPSDAG